jgi:ubiquinone/menaquinone biosynthesis C-methylase UbiE
MSDQLSQDKIREQIRQGYSEIAKKGVFTTVIDDAGTCSSGGSCCGGTDFDVEKLVKDIGYSETELASIPASANMGLSCGNPTAIATLKEGDVVLDLGCGGGFDAFIAGPKVGASGRVIGVDMTAEMITKARANSSIYSERTGLKNVEFRLGEIQHIPVADNSVDVVISNCVLNLSPDKPQVWREIGRVLKPGGYVAISDIALLKALPIEVLKMAEALVGCVAGAALVSAVETMIEAAGFEDIKLTSKAEYIEAMMNSKDPLYGKIIAALPANSNPRDFITSLDITARKLKLAKSSTQENSGEMVFS